MVAGFLWVREQGCLLVPLVYSVSSSIPPSLSMCVCVRVCMVWCDVVNSHSFLGKCDTSLCCISPQHTDRRSSLAKHNRCIMYGLWRCRWRIFLPMVQCIALMLAPHLGCTPVHPAVASSTHYRLGGMQLHHIEECIEWLLCAIIDDNWWWVWSQHGESDGRDSPTVQRLIVIV